MFYTVLALVLTVLMGGIIAYNGDVIGRKFGKRRASIFGLRPRHTAILITTCTGILISALTTGVLFLVVPPVRAVIMEGEQALRQNRELRASTRVAREEAAQARLARDMAQSELLKKQDLLREQQAKVTFAQQQLTRVQAQLVQAIQKEQREQARNARLTALNQSLERRSRDLRNQNNALAVANVDLREQNVALRAENQAEQARNQQFQKSNSDLAEENDRLVRENARLGAESTKIREVIQRQEENNTRLALESRRLEQENRRLQTEFQDLQEKKDSLDRQYGELVRSVAEISGRNKDFIQLFETLRTSRLAVHVGEELARVEVPRNTPPDKVRALVNEALHLASVAAQQKGASAGDGVRAVRVASRRYLTQAGTAGPVLATDVTEEDRISAVVERASRSPEPVCLLVLAVGNSVEGETATVDIQPLPNKLIYARGQPVSSIRLNASAPSHELFGDLVAFLRSIGKSALERGMIPRLDPITGEPQVGALGVPEIVRLLERVRSFEGRVRITAIASMDTNSSDALDLQFKVERSA